MENSKEFFELQVKKNVARLSRDLLDELDDILAEQRIKEEELFKVLPKEYHLNVKLANPLTEQRLKLLRKRILDATNGHSRDILGDLQHYQIVFNFQKDKV